MKIFKIKSSIYDLYSHDLNDYIVTVIGNITAGTFTLCATTINVKVFLTQKILNLGLTSDVENFNSPVSPPYTDLVQNKLSFKLNELGILHGFMTGATVTLPPVLTLPDFYSESPIDLTGLTESKLSILRNSTGGLTEGLNLNPGVGKHVVKVDSTGLTETNYTMGVISYVTTDEDNNYELQDVNSNFVTKLTSFNIDPTNSDLGWNEDNIIYSGVTREEENIGFIFPAEIESSIFIERGRTSPFEYHLRLAEVENLEHLDYYNNGFYNIKKIEKN